MDIQLKQDTPTEGTLQVTILDSDYRPGLRKRMKHYSQRAQIAGFRRGQVPIAHIQKVYGKTLLFEELNELLKRCIQEYIEKTELKTLGAPILEEADPLGAPSAPIDYHFSYQIGLQPEVKADHIDKISLTQYEIKAEEQDFEEFIENLQYRFGTTTHPERIQELDVVLVGQLRGPNERTESITLSYAEMQPGSQSHFQGHRPGDEIPVQLSVLYSSGRRPATLQRLEQQGFDLSAHYTFHLEQIDQVQKAELNESLFKKVYGTETPTTKDEFLDKSRQHLQSQYEIEGRRLLHTQLKDRLIQELGPPLPERYLRKHFEANIPDEHKDKMDDHTLERSFNRYLKDLQWRMIQSKLAQVHQIKVAPEVLYQEVERLFLRQARIYGDATEEQRKELRPFVEKYLSSAEHRETLYAQLQEEQILERIAQIVRLKKQSIAPSAFHKLSSEYHASLEQ